MSGPRIALVLGKPPERSPVLPDVIARLDGRAEVMVHVPSRGAPVDPVAWSLRTADLVAVRGLGQRALAALAVVEDAGVRCCNRIAATLAVRDRVLVHRLLTAAGVPVPATTEVPTWEDVTAGAAGSVMVKAVDGRSGRGTGVLPAPDGVLPTEPPFPGPYLVQRFVPNDGRDRKLYVIGDRVAGLLKRWPRAPGDQEAGVPFPVEPDLEALARRVGAAIGLELYGVDVVVGPGGPAVVDVNPFPSCSGVQGAATSIAEHLLVAASGPAVAQRLAGGTPA